MVASQNNGCLIRNACLFQLLHQVGQCFFQLNIAGKVALSCLCVTQVLDLVIVPRGHRIGSLIVLVMAGEGHVVGMELLIGRDIICY